jgi:hypothetical protein
MGEAMFFFAIRFFEYTTIARLPVPRFRQTGVHASDEYDSTDQIAYLAESSILSSSRELVEGLGKW